MSGSRRRRSATNQATSARPPAARIAGRTTRPSSSRHRSASRCMATSPPTAVDRGGERLDGTGHGPGRAAPERVAGDAQGDELDEDEQRGQPDQIGRPACGTALVHPSATPVAAARPASTTSPRLRRRAASRPITAAAARPTPAAARRGSGEVRPRRTSTPGPSARADAPSAASGRQRGGGGPGDGPPTAAATPRRRPPSATRATGAGSRVVAPMPPARTTAAPVVAHSSTGDRSMRSSHQKLAVEAMPSTSSMVAQSVPTWIGERGDDDRDQEGAEVVEHAAGGRQRPAQPATGHQAASAHQPSAASFSASGMWSHCTVTNTAAAAKISTAPSGGHPGGAGPGVVRHRDRAPGRVRGRGGAAVGGRRWWKRGVVHGDHAAPAGRVAVPGRSPRSPWGLLRSPGPERSGRRPATRCRARWRSGRAPGGG